METNSYGADKLEFRQIILGHLKRILDISCHELRDGVTIVSHGNYDQTTIQEDTRFSYMQSIENLAYVLMPYFDKDMKKVYDDCIKIIGGFNYEVSEFLKVEKQKILKESKEDELSSDFIIKLRLRYAKKMFCELNLLLKRVSYLKSVVFGEEKNEVVEENGDEEKEKKK